MEYIGKLYGKIGNSYFSLLETSEDVENIKKHNKQLLDACKSVIRHGLIEQDGYETVLKEVHSAISIVFK